jgi:hypothetical protein
LSEAIGLRKLPRLIEFKKITKAQASPIEPVVEPSRARLDADPTHAVGPPPDLDVEVGVVSRAAPPPDLPWGHRDLPSCTAIAGSGLPAPSLASSSLPAPPPPNPPWGHRDPSSYAAVKGSYVGPHRIRLGAAIEGSLCCPQPDPLPYTTSTRSAPLCCPQLEREGGAPPCERSLFGFGN